MNSANNGGKWIRPEKRDAIYRRDDNQCVYCCTIMTDDVVFSIDHIVPQELGGSNHESNLITACKSCNCKKGSKTLRQFFKQLRAKGVDTDAIRQRIRRNTRRKLRKELK